MLGIFSTIWGVVCSWRSGLQLPARPAGSRRGSCCAGPGVNFDLLRRLRCFVVSSGSSLRRSVCSWWGIRRSVIPLCVPHRLVVLTSGRSAICRSFTMEVEGFTWKASRCSERSFVAVNGGDRRLSWQWVTSPSGLRKICDPFVTCGVGESSWSEERSRGDRRSPL